MRKIPDELAEKQEQMRRATADAVTSAILELQAQGYDVKIKDIIHLTGLSRSVFAKSHIRRVLVEYGVVEARTKGVRESHGKMNDSAALRTLLAEKDGYINRLVLENDRLKEECEILRGKVFLLMHKNSISNDNEL